MKGKVVDARFFKKPTVHVAEDLLGKFLMAKTRHGVIARMITDVEIYDGLRDRASHAHRGRTPRNAVMFGLPGHWYVYFTYGMHWMLNIVTREEGHPGAVLFRGVEGIAGPGRLTKILGVDGRYNTKSAVPRSGLWIEDRGIRIPKSAIQKGPRIGIASAGPYWAKRRLRFWIRV